MLCSTYNLKSWVHLQFNIRIITSDNQYCFRLSAILTLLQSIFKHFKNIFILIKYFGSKSQLQGCNLSLKILFLLNTGKANTCAVLLKNPHLWFHHQFGLKYFSFWFLKWLHSQIHLQDICHIKNHMLIAREISSPQFLLLVSSGQ